MHRLMLSNRARDYLKGGTSLLETLPAVPPVIGRGGSLVFGTVAETGFRTTDSQRDAWSQLYDERSEGLDCNGG